MQDDLQVACWVPLRKHCKFAVVRSTSEVQSNTMLLSASTAPLQSSEIDGGARNKMAKTGKFGLSLLLPHTLAYLSIQQKWEYRFFQVI